MSQAVTTLLSPTVSPEWPRRVRMFGIELDVVTLAEAVHVIQAWIQGVEGPCRYVVTPNVDHVVMLSEHAGLRAAYADAGLVIADGWPIVTASRWLGCPLPERVPGSDLVPAVLAAACPDAPLRVYLLGAGPGVAERAAERIRGCWPAVVVTGCYSPPPGFEWDGNENRAIIRRVADAAPDLLIVGLGAPKQEVWVHAHHEQLAARVAICAGATIDFLAGEKRRAPEWMQRRGLEWLHRLATEPRRLSRRYGRDALVFPRLVAHEGWERLCRRFRSRRRRAQ